MITPGKYVPRSKSVYWFKSYQENRILNTYILGDFAVAFWTGTVSMHFITELSVLEQYLAPFYMVVGVTKLRLPVL